MKKKDTIQKVVLMSFSTAVCLLIIEVALRVFYPQISDHDAMFRNDELLGWTFIPEKRGAIFYPGEASHYIETNASGFRDDDFEKGKKGKRIMFIGDSFVSNVSVTDDDVFTEVLERNIPGLDAMNFGVNGYGQVQEMLLLDKWVNETEPDLVVLTVYVRNDFADNIGKGQWNRKKPIALLDKDTDKVSLSSLMADTKQVKPKGRFYHKLHLYHFVSRRFANMRNRNVSEKTARYLSLAPPELYLCKNEPDAQMLEMQQIMEFLILEMNQRLKQRNIPLILVIAPSIVQIEDDLWERLISDNTNEPEQFDRQRPNKWLKQWGDNWQIATLDLFPTLYQETGAGNVMYNRREQHWTREGNAIVAEALEDFIRIHVNPLF